MITNAHFRLSLQMPDIMTPDNQSVDELNVESEEFESVPKNMDTLHSVSCFVFMYTGMLNASRLLFIYVLTLYYVCSSPCKHKILLFRGFTLCFS